LENTNEIRFLRKRYKDPMTGKDEWRLIHLGEAKVPPMGLFGQPLAVGVPAAAVGSSPGGTSAGTSGAVGLGGPGAGDSSGGAVGVGTGGVLSGGTTAAGGPAGATGSGDTSSTDTFTQGGGGTGFIVGVSSNNTRESIRTYKNQTHYNQWEFVYNPAEERAGAGLAPAPVGNTGAAPNSPSSGPGYNPPSPPAPPPGTPPGS
jgi:hypothetical protein